MPVQQSPEFPSIPFMTRLYCHYDHARRRAQGFRFVSYRYWWLNPARRLGRDLGKIKRQIAVADFGVTLEMGCHVGRLTPAIRSHCREVWGADVFPASAAPVDRYLLIPADPVDASYFPSLPDACLDTIVCADFVGWPRDQTWENVFTATHNRRLARYCTPRNFPRLLKPGGLFIVLQQETEPELRLGRMTHEALTESMESLHPHIDIPGFTFLLKGYCFSYVGPFIAYRRMVAP